MKRQKRTLLIIFTLAVLAGIFMAWRAKKVSEAPKSTFQGPPAGSIPYVKGPTGLPPQ